MRVRTIEDVINGIRRGISAISPELGTFPKFGNLYAIVRGVASTITELEVGIQDEINRLRASKAKGADLDTLASEYGVVRFNGTHATGYVLASKLNDTLLRKGTILTNATKDLQYQVMNDTYIQPGSEVPVYVKSTTQRSFTNLRAENYLYSRLYPGATFLVGQYRSPSGTPIGNLSGGSDPEDDGSLRARVIEFLNGSYNALTPLNIQARLRNNFGTRDLYVKDTLDTPGMFYIYTSFRDETLKRELLDLTYRIKPIGVIPIVKTFYKSRLDISITITVSSYNYISLITTQVDQIIDQYTNALGVGEPFIVGELNRRLGTVPYVKRITIDNPLLDEIPNSNVLVTVGDIDKTVIEED